MKVENKSLIITDPCYFAKDEHWGQEFDWFTNKINISDFSEYLWTSTGFGDGTIEAFEVSEVDKDHIEDFFTEIKTAGRIGDEDTYKSLCDLLIHTGEFTVDSGTMCVAIYDEVMKYNPKPFETLPERCYYIIENFSGTVDILTDEEGVNHFVLVNDDQIKPIVITY